MNVEKNRQHAWLAWLFVVVLVALCAALGVLQYRWIGEVSQAEHERLRGGLRASLERLSQDFNAEITAACAALVPSSPEAADSTEQAYALRYAQWRNSGRHNGLFRRIALAVPEGDSPVLRNLDLDTGTFGAAEWPPTWNGLRDRLTARLSGDPSGRPQPFGMLSGEETTLIDLPHFGRPEGRPDRPREREWLLVEVDADYARAVLLPELVERHLGRGEKLDYQVEVAARDNPSTMIYQSQPDRASHIGFHADASVSLFELQYDQIMRRVGRAGGRGPGGPPPPSSDRGRWLLSVRHRAGSLEAVVEQARRRNLGVTAAVLVLMLAAIGALVQFTRRAQALAELQMEFVAGVSHELRTPLSVIRTAGHVLGGGVIRDAKQVQRYGSLIEQESEKLTGIVEQVLRFSSVSKGGRLIYAREVVEVESLIEDALDACARMVEQSHCTVEKSLEPGLPPVLGDPTALKHALQNLLSNAAKYGSEGGWIGISASAATNHKNTVVEIRVADRGPGIPHDELEQIFDPFYRGKRAIEDQIHGTGLGLSLVKRIVEAHEGKVTVHSEPSKGTEFVVRIPAAPADQIDEFADPAGRG